MPPIPPTKKKPISDFASALQQAASGSVADVAESPAPVSQPKGKSDFAMALEEAAKKKVGTTDGGNTSTTSAPSPSGSEAQSPSTTTETNGQTLGNSYNIATLNGAIKPEGTFNNKPVEDNSMRSILSGTNTGIANDKPTPSQDVKVGETVLPDIKEAIDSTAIKNIQRRRGVYDKTLPPPTKDEIKSETDRVTQAYKNGDIIPSLDGGKSVMKRGIGVAETFFKALNDAKRTKAEDAYFESLSNDERARYLNLKQEFPQSFETSDNSTTPGSKVMGINLGQVGKDINSISEFGGENAGMLSTVTTGAMALTAAAPAIAASTALVGTAGAGEFGGFLALSNDMAGFKNNYEKAYYSLKKQGLSDEEAAVKAETAGRVGYATSLGVNAALSSNVGNAVSSASTEAVEGLINGLVKSTEHLVKREIPKMAITSGAASLADSAGQSAVGVDVNWGDAFKEAANAAGSGAVTALSFWGLHQAAKIATSIPSYIRPLLENVAATTPVESREAYLNKAVEQGIMTEPEKVKVSKSINEFGETKPAVQDLPIPEEKKAAITGKLIQAKKLQEEIDSLTPYGASFNDRIAQLNAAKENIHADINKMYGAEDVFEVEHDSLTGEKPVKGEPENISQPIELSPEITNAPNKEVSFEDAGNESKNKQDASILGGWILDNSKEGDTITDKDGNGYEVTGSKVRKDGVREVLITPFEIDENGNKDYNHSGVKLISDSSKNSAIGLFENSYTNSNGERVIDQYKYNPKENTTNGENKAAEAPNTSTESQAVTGIERPSSQETPAEIPTDNNHAEVVKTKFRDQFKAKGVSDEHIDGAIALMDARSKSWASEEKGRKPEDWYSKIADVGSGDFSVDDVQYQSLPKPVKRVSKFAALMYAAFHLNAGEISRHVQYKDDVTTKTILNGISNYNFFLVNDSSGKVEATKIDPKYSPLQKYVYNLWEKAGYPKIEVDLESNIRSHFNPLTNTISLTRRAQHDLVESGEEGKLYASSDLVLAEIAHALQSTDGKISTGRAAFDFMKSGLNYSNSYKVKGTIENEAHSEIEPRLVNEFNQILNAIRFQQNDAVKKGAMETLKDGRVIIHALTNPDFSTMVHEIGHVFEKDLTDAEKKTVKDAGGSEVFARGFERYLRDGNAPTKELSTLFGKFKNWLSDIYQSLKGSPIEKKVSPEIKGIFDRLLTEKAPIDESQNKSTEVVQPKTDAATTSSNESVPTKKESSTAANASEDKQAAKQEIEKRRDEELSKVRTLKSYFEVGNKLTIDGREYTVVKNGEHKFNIETGTGNNRETFVVGQSYNDLDRLKYVANQNGYKANGEAEINAKYDAELAALDKKASSATSNTNNEKTNTTAATPIEDKQGASKEGIKDFTPVETINEGYRKLKEKLGERKAKRYFEQANRLVNPNQNEIVDYRENGVVVKKGDRYILKPFADMDLKNWRIASFPEKNMDVTDQFTNKKIENKQGAKQEIVDKPQPKATLENVIGGMMGNQGLSLMDADIRTKGESVINNVDKATPQQLDKISSDLKRLKELHPEKNLEVTRTEHSYIIKSKENASNKSQVPQQKMPEQSSQREHARTSQEQNTEATKTTNSNSDLGSEGRPKEKISRTKASGNLRKLSENIRKDGILPNWAKADLPEGTQSQGFGGKSLDEAVAKALDLVADAIDAGKGLSDSVNEGFAHLQDYYSKNTTSFNRDKLQWEFKINIRKQLGVDEGYKRSFTKQVLSDEAILPKKEIAKKLDYVRQGNELTIQEATKLIDEVGVDEAYNLIVNEGDLKPAVRSTVGQMLIKKYNTLAREATDPATKEKYWDKTIDTADLVSEKMATGAGQMIQAFSLYEKLSPEAQVRSTIREAKKSSEVKRTKQRQTAKDLSEKMNAANHEAIDEVLGSNDAKLTVEKAESNRKVRARQKIERARTKREEIINKYKQDKGKTLYSTVPGLTVEGMEYVGNLAKTYIDEGVANVELIAEKIKEHLVATTSKPTNEEVDKQVRKAVSDKLNQADVSLINKGLKDMKADINKLIKDHFTESNKTKKELSKKLVEEAGLTGEDAKELERKVKDAFDRVATRKKNAILEREKSKLDALQNGLQGTRKVERKQVQDEIIKLSNLGAFENEQLLDVVGKKLGLGEITPMQAQMVQELAEKVQAAPEGAPKRDATQDLLNYRSNIRGTSMLELGQGIWYANVLSGYKTHEKNVVSTFIDGFAYYASEVARDPSALPFLTVGGLKGLKRGAFEAWHTLSTGRSPIHVLNIETSNVLERKKFIGGFLNPANYLKYVTRAMVAEDVLQFQGLKEMKAYQYAYSEAKREGKTSPDKSIWQRVNEKLLNTPQRVAVAEQQIKEEGLKGADAKRRMFELMELSRPVEMTETAYGFAAKGTFNHETEGTLGALTDLVSHVLDFPAFGARPVRFLVPFTKIIANVVNNALDFSPVGMVRAYKGTRGLSSFEGSKFLKGKYKLMSVEERRQTFAKASLGLGITAAIYAMTKIKKDDGSPVIDVTGAGTGDYKKDAQLKIEGWQPYSLKIGDTYLSYEYTPLVFNLAWIGNWNDREKYDKNASADSFLQKVSMNAFQNVALISDMTWISTSANLLNALSSQTGGANLVDKAGKELANSAKSFVLPNAYTQAAQEFESLNRIPQKETNGIFQNLIQDIPVARNSLNDRLNALGEPIVRDPDVFLSQETQDPVWKFMLDKKGWIAPPSKKTMVYDGKIKADRPLTEDEYYNYVKIRGAKLKKGIEEIMKKGVWIDAKGKATINPNVAVKRKAPEEITPADMANALKGLSTKVTKQAKKQLFATSQ